MSKLLQGKVALITGGSRGIGKTLVTEFADQGATVVFTYAGSVDKANALAAELTAKGHTVRAVQADAADFAKAQQVVDDIVKEFSKIDIVVNNAGITRDNLLLRMNEQQFDEVIAANLKSVFNYTKAASKHFLKQRSGAFINMGSIVGVSGNAGQSNYAASKGGMNAFTMSVAKELGSRGIRANVVAPGFIATEMTAAIPEAEMQKWLTGIPLGRAGTPDDVAKLCVFLGSDWATYITGQVIQINGGMG
jgi:3-oxoacyl-[acyl-carrier protein] reductase